MGNELEKDLAKKLKDISKQKSFKMVSFSIYQEINDLFGKYDGDLWLY